jgi:hypothetical protein
MAGEAQTIRQPGMTNAEYLRALREDASSRGLCYQCRIRTPRPGRRSCDECLRRVKEWKTGTLKGRASTKKHRAAGRKRRTERRKLAGLCIRCGIRPTEAKRVSCSVCLDVAANKARADHRAKVGKAGSICGSPDHQEPRHERAGAPA